VAPVQYLIQSCSALIERFSPILGWGKGKDGGVQARASIRSGLTDRVMNIRFASSDE
jgi:hypothetical protein